MAFFNKLLEVSQGEPFLDAVQVLLMMVQPLVCVGDVVVDQGQQQ